MNRIISEELFKKAISIMATYASSNPKWTYQDVEQDPSGVHATLEQLRNAPLATTFDGTGVRQWTPYEIAIAKGDGILLGRHRFYLDDDLATLHNAGQVGVSTGAEFFPAVDDLTDMIDHWKENTDMDTHDLVEGVIGYFRDRTVRVGYGNEPWR